MSWADGRQVRMLSGVAFESKEANKAAKEIALKRGWVPVPSQLTFRCTMGYIIDKISETTCTASRMATQFSCWW